MLRSLAKDSLIYTLPAVFSRGIAFFLIPLYTRALAPGDFGSLDLLLTFASIINLTIALEISQAVARFYPIEKDLERQREYASTAFWFTLLTYSVFGAITLALSSQLAPAIMGRNDLTTEFTIGVAYIVLNGIFYLIQNQFKWEFKSKHYAICSTILTLSTAIAAVWLAYWLQMGLKGLLIGMLVGALSGCAYGLIFLRNSFRLPFKVERLKEMLLFSLPLVPSGIAIFINTYADRLIINHYMSLEDVGLYGIASRLAGASMLLMAGLQGALGPLIYKNHELPETPNHIATAFRIFIFISLIFYIMASFFSYELLALLTTPDYYAAAPLIIFLIPAFFLSQMYIFAPGIGLAKKTKYVMYINICGAILNILLNFALIPVMGITGAAIGTLISYLVIFIAYMTISQRLYKAPHKWRPVSILAIFAFVLGLLTYYTSTLGFMRYILIAPLVGTFCAMALRLKLIHAEELSRFFRTLKTSLSIK